MVAICTVSEDVQRPKRKSTSACVINYIIYYTFGTLYIVMGDYGLDFITVMMFLHGSDSDCGFTTTFYKAAKLIMGGKSL